MRNSAASKRVSIVAVCLLPFWATLSWAQSPGAAPPVASGAQSAQPAISIAGSASASSSAPNPTASAASDKSATLSKDVCAEAISPENAKRLFDAIKDQHGPDNCKLETVKTERNIITVEWNINDKLASTIQVIPASCAKPDMLKGPKLAMTKPEAQDRCPDANSALVKTINSDIFGTLVTISDNPPLPPPTTTRSPLLLIAVAIAVLLSTILAFRTRKQSPQPDPKSEPPPEDKGGLPKRSWLMAHSRSLDFYVNHFSKTVAFHREKKSTNPLGLKRWSSF